MLTVHYGGKEGQRIQLRTEDSLLAVRTYSRHMVSDPRPEGSELSAEAREIIQTLEPVFQLPEAGVEVLQRPARRPRGPAVSLESARARLAAEADIRFAGRALVDPASGAPVLYTENLFVKFHRQVSERKRRALLRKYTLVEKRELEYATNAVFAAAPEGTGTNVFAIAEALLAEGEVELCHPELVRESRSKRAFDEQWHLKKTRINNRTDAPANPCLANSTSAALISLICVGAIEMKRTVL